MLYLKPPRGDILLDELQGCVTARVNYFLHKYKRDSRKSELAIKFEYLALGTALDRVGHFILRLLCVQSDQLKEFILPSEATFLIERLEYLSSKQIRQLINTTLRHLDEFEQEDLYTTIIKYLLTEIKCAFISKHMHNFNHDVNCTIHYFKVPFQLCPSLVAKRELLMDRGEVIVPCGKWKIFLKCFFEFHMNHELKKLESSAIVFYKLSDHRLQDLKDGILSSIKNNSIQGANKINIQAHELEKLKGIFPLCMANLYNILKNNHRLGHNARFCFSLFLKDIGMSLNDSIIFWKSEYSKPSKCGGKCSHSWQKDGAKYTYGIRHLYGLEGRRANYYAPSCLKIQSNSVGAAEEGGCPIQNFDLKQLQKLLNQNIVENNEIIDEIMYLRSQNQSIKACDVYLKALMKTSNKETLCTDAKHKTPVEYFLFLNEQLNLLNKD